MASEEHPQRERPRNDPKWDEAGRVHDWRNYVPDEVRAMWDDLDDLGRRAVYLTAKEMADLEEWE